ncbi:helix-turn-helix domain-containing protein [Photobacterium leiognathi subsp. mandapamensis]
MKDLGMKIKNERKKRGLKQKDLALLLNVTSQAISGWERGVTFPQLELYERIAIALNVSKDWLFFDDENKKSITMLIFSMLRFIQILKHQPDVDAVTNIQKLKNIHYQFNL